MAFFEQRKNGWRAQIRRRGMPSISRTFDLKADAEAWAREVERELQRGNVAALRDDAGRTTFAEIADRYAADVLPGLRGKSAGAYVRAARTRFGPLFLSSIRGVDVADWASELSRSGLAAQTVIHHVNAVAAIFTYASKRLSIALPAGNPARSIPRPAQPKSRDRRLRAGEMDALLMAADSTKRTPELRQIITLAVETSMRLGELLGLEWRRIDLVRRTAHLVDTKNGESRTVALSSAALEALRAMHALPRRMDGRVFSWAGADSFEKAWTRCKARARAVYEADCAASGTKPDPAFLADLRFHDLRHEATSRLFEKGLGVMEVASMTGHKSLSMLKRYTHIEAEKLAKKLG
jgi:integrase